VQPRNKSKVGSARTHTSVAEGAKAPLRLGLGLSSDWEGAQTPRPLTTVHVAPASPPLVVEERPAGLGSPYSRRKSRTSPNVSSNPNSNPNASPPQTIEQQPPPIPSSNPALLLAAGAVEKKGKHGVMLPISDDSAA
jgi:hypothetical protein